MTKVDHDSGYKLLFSHPEIVEDLLRAFVPEPWTQRLDYRTLEKVSCSFVTDDLRDREDDVIWRVRLGETWVYVYLLIEFQSWIDPWMAVRMMVRNASGIPPISATARMRTGRPLSGSSAR